MKRVLIWGSGIVVALAFLALAVTWPRIASVSGVGAGYVALNMCACTEIGGRDWDACRLDIPPDMDSVRAESVERAGRRGARAWVPLYAERTAIHYPPDGCTLERPD